MTRCLTRLSIPLIVHFQLRPEPLAHEHEPCAPVRDEKRIDAGIGGITQWPQG
jgi:hypothetical protein